MSLVKSEDVERISSVRKILSEAECEQIFAESPALLEVREFIVKHSLESQALSSGQQTGPRSDPRIKPTKPAIPVASLRDMVVALLEEQRYEDGLQFLASIGASTLVEDARMIKNMLSVFRSTDEIEKELKQRSSFLLENNADADMDFSKAWRIDDDRRQAIIRSQQGVLTYLSAANVQYLEPWFSKTFESYPGDFWLFFEALLVPPQPGNGRAADLLEEEMYQHRVSMACLLVEQMCADLAAKADNMWESMFFRATSEGFDTFQRIAHPKKLLSIIVQCAKAALHGRCPAEENRLTTLLIEMLAVTSACGLIARDRCVQTLAKHLVDEYTVPCADFLTLITSDMLAADVIVYALASWYRFDKTLDKKANGNMTQRQAVSMPHSVARTAFFLRCTRPNQQLESSTNWYELVTMLLSLVQRTVCLFVRRVCYVNHDLFTKNTAHCSVLIATLDEDPDSAVELLLSAYDDLETYVENKLPRPDSPTSSFADTDDIASIFSADSDEDEDIYEERVRAKIYAELRLLKAFLQRV
ncbi:hypothetical protein GGI07_002664 [Coemansia sp. Benny D115]|nr:hypothetical protein GGI07_002664 [Coemansia sp. Benny D115]